VLYRYALTVPASTPETAPVTDLVTITYGVLRNVTVLFPPGCAGLVHVAIQYHGSQIIPLSAGTYLASDSEPVSWPEEIPVFYPPFQFELLGWSDDDTFEHTIVFRLNILPERMQRAGGIVQRLLGSLPGLGEL